jgi:hypothetical protein
MQVCFNMANTRTLHHDDEEDDEYAGVAQQARHKDVVRLVAFVQPALTMIWVMYG